MYLRPSTCQLTLHHLPCICPDLLRTLGSIGASFAAPASWFPPKCLKPALFIASKNFQDMLPMCTQLPLPLAVAPAPIDTPRRQTANISHKQPRDYEEMPSLHVSASTRTTRTRLLQGDGKDAGSPALLIPVQLAFGFGGGPVGAAGTAFKPCISAPQLVNSHYITCPASARICSAPWGPSGQVLQHQRPGFHPNV